MAEPLDQLLTRIEPLKKLTETRAVTEIHIAIDGTIRHREGKGAWKSGTLKAKDAEALLSALRSAAEQNTGNNHPIQGAAMAEEGPWRWLAPGPSLSRAGFAIYAMRVRRSRPAAADLVSEKLATPQSLELLDGMLSRGEGVVISGPTGGTSSELLAGLLNFLGSERHALLLEGGQGIDTEGLSLTVLRRSRLPTEAPGRHVFEDFIVRADVLVADGLLLESSWDWVLSSRRLDQPRLISTEARSPSEALGALIARAGAALGTKKPDVRGKLNIRALVILRKEGDAVVLQGIYEMPEGQLRPELSFGALKALLGTEKGENTLPPEPPRRRQPPASQSPKSQNKMPVRDTSPPPRPPASRSVAPRPSPSRSIQALRKPSTSSSSIQPLSRSQEIASVKTPSKDKPIVDAALGLASGAEARIEKRTSDALSSRSGSFKAIGSSSGRKAVDGVRPSPPTSRSIRKPPPPDINRSSSSIRSLKRPSEPLSEAPVEKKKPSPLGEEPPTVSSKASSDLQGPKTRATSPNSPDTKARLQRRLGKPPEARAWSEPPEQSVTKTSTSIQAEDIEERPTTERSPLPERSPSETPPPPPLQPPPGSSPRKREPLSNASSRSGVISRARSSASQRQDSSIEKTGPTSTVKKPRPKPEPSLDEPKDASTSPPTSAKSRPVPVPTRPRPPEPAAGAGQSPRRVLSGTISRIPRRPPAKSEPGTESPPSSSGGTGNQRRMSRYQAINRSASFKPAEDEPPIPGGLRTPNPSVLVQVGGAASTDAGENDSTAAFSLPSDDELATLQKDTAAFDPLSSSGDPMDIDETNEMNVNRIKKALEDRLKGTKT